VIFSSAARARKQGIFSFGDEPSGGQIEHKATIHFGIKSKVEIIERVVWVAESSLLPPSRDQPFATQVQLVSDQARDQINRRHGFGLGLAESSFQRACHTAEAQLS
jgi:hypothetical protein